MHISYLFMETKQYVTWDVFSYISHRLLKTIDEQNKNKILRVGIKDRQFVAY